MFHFYYKIIGLFFSKLENCALRATGFPVFGPGVWAGYGPETCGPGRAWAKAYILVCGPGPGWILAASCEPGLG